MRLKSEKKNSLPNPDESLKYINFYSCSSPRLISSFRYNFGKTCGWLTRAKTKIEISWKATSLKVINKPIFHMLLRFYQPKKED